MNGRWLVVAEIYKYQDFNKETIFRWVKVKDFPTYKIGNLYKFELLEIYTWVKRKDKS